MKTTTTNNRLDELLDKSVPYDNDLQEYEGDHYLVITKEQALINYSFWHWCREWGDD